MKPRGLRFAEEAEEDLARLFEFLAEKDLPLAERAYRAIRKALGHAKQFPYMSRKVDDDPYLREIVIPFGRAGYVALFRISDDFITVIGVRHQREDDYG